MKKLILAGITAAALLAGGALVPQNAQAAVHCWWTGPVRHCVYTHPHWWWRHHHPWWYR